MALVPKIVKLATPSGPSGMPIGSAPGGGTIIIDPTAPGGTRVVYGSFPIGGGGGYLVPPDKPSGGGAAPSPAPIQTESQKASIARAETALQNQLRDKLQRLQEGKIKSFVVPSWFQNIGGKKIDAGNVGQLTGEQARLPGSAEATKLSAAVALSRGDNAPAVSKPPFQPGASQPIIYEKVIGTESGVPITETRYKDIAQGVDRLATTEEQQYLMKQPREGGYIKTKEVPYVSKTLRYIRETSGKVTGRLEEFKSETRTYLKSFGNVGEGILNIDKTPGFFTPFKAAKNAVYGATSFIQEKRPYLAAALQLPADILPTKTSDLIFLELGVKAYNVLPKTTGIALTGLGLYGASRTNEPTEKFKGLLFAGVTGVGLPVAEYSYRRYSIKKDLLKYESMLKEKSPAKYLEYKTKMKEAESLSGISPKIKEIDLSRLKLLEDNKLAQDVIKEFFKEKGGKTIVGGSIAQQTQIEGVGTKRPGDIDVYVRGLKILQEKRTGLYARELSKRLNKAGLKTKSEEGKIYVNDIDKPLIDFHTYNLSPTGKKVVALQPNIEAVYPFYKPASFGIRKTPSKIRVLDINVQLKRKLIGGYLEPFMTGKNRLKDIPAAKAIKESLLKTKAIEDIELNKIISEKGTYPQFMSFGMGIRGKGLNTELDIKFGGVKEPGVKLGSFRGREDSSYKRLLKVSISKRNILNEPGYKRYSFNKLSIRPGYAGYSSKNALPRYPLSSYLKQEKPIYKKAKPISLDFPYKPKSFNRYSLLRTPRSSYPYQKIKTPKLTPPTISPPYTPRNAPRKALRDSLLYFDIEPKKSLISQKSYSVFKISKRKPIKVAEGLTREMALDVGAAVTIKDLTATFGIRESNAPLVKPLETGREFSRYRDLFREPAARSKYRKYGTVFVQRRTKVGNLGGRLAFPGEKLAIQRAKLNKIMGAIK